jgi:acyl-coenzyme A synthetase/AMP-(fatty) acid ligase
MQSDVHWISTPQIAPDHRGPVDREFVPFVDPAVSPTILELLESIAGRAPDNIVVDDERGALTYAELRRSVCVVAARIAETGTSGHVAILLPSSAQYAIAIFACIAAGRPCVLLDENYPAARNAEIAMQTGVQLVLTSPAGTPSWPRVKSLVVALDTPGADHAFASGAKSAALSLDEPAFVLCTSGSSGSPKPIVHSQRTMLHWARSVHNALHVRADDRALSLSSLSSLGGITGLLAFCFAGAGVQMLDLKTSGLGGLLDTLQRKPITILRAAPSMMRGLAQLPQARAAFSRLRVVQTYGEPLMKADVVAIAGVLPATCFIRSTYGSTEASGLSWFAGEPDDHDPLRAASGALMPDTSAAIVDDDGCCAVPQANSGSAAATTRSANGSRVDSSQAASRLMQAATARASTAPATSRVATTTAFSSCSGASTG